MPLYRISVIFRVRSAKAVKITDAALLKRLGIICGAIGTCLLVRTLVSPPDVVVGRTADDLKAFLCKTDWWDYTFTSSKFKHQKQYAKGHLKGNSLAANKNEKVKNVGYVYALLAAKIWNGGKNRQKICKFRYRARNVTITRDQDQRQWDEYFVLKNRKRILSEHFECTQIPCQK